MGRTYAGILALLAFFVVVARSMIHGGEPSSTLFDAWLALLVFATVGFVAGRLAEWIIDDALRAKVLAEISARDAATGNEASHGNTSPAKANPTTGVPAAAT